MKGARARRGVSTVVGAIIAVPVLVALLLAALYAGSAYIEQTARYAERAGEALALVPVVNSTGVYVEVFNSGSVSTRVLYIVARNLTDGSLIIVLVNASLAPGDTLTIKLSNATTGRIAVYAVTSRGGVHPWSPVLPGLNDGILDLPDDILSTAPTPGAAGEAAWFLEGLGACFLETWNYTVAGVERFLFNASEASAFEVNASYLGGGLFNVSYVLGGVGGWAVVGSAAVDRWVGVWRLEAWVTAYGGPWGANYTLHVRVTRNEPVTTVGWAWYAPAGCYGDVSYEFSVARRYLHGSAVVACTAAQALSGAQALALPAVTECLLYGEAPAYWPYFNATSGAGFYVIVPAGDPPGLVATLNGTVHWIAAWGLAAPTSPAQVRGGG